MMFFTCGVGFILLFYPILGQRPWYPGGCQPDTEQEQNFTGTYMVLAPRTVRPGLPYAVSVNLMRGPAATISVGICDDKNTTIVQSVLDNVQPATTATAQIANVPTTLVPETQYTLCIKGTSSSGAVLFEQKKTLQFDSKALSIFVQTDKAVYKPGTLVQYRVIVVTSDLKPVTGTVDITISDPNNNVIKQLGNQSLSTGVSTQSLMLSEEPPLGDWTIKVVKSGQTMTKTFSVDKYVLPRFEVTLDIPAVVLNTDDLVVTVRGKYTYGKGVKGKAEVSASYPWIYSKEQLKDYPPITMFAETNDDGEAKVTFKNADLKRSNLMQQWGGSIRVVGKVIEGLTGMDRNASKDVTIYTERYRVEIHPASETFKPGLTLPVQVSVVTQDGKPITGTDASRNVFVRTTYSFPYNINGTEEPIVKSESLTLDKDGTVLMQLSPSLTVDRISIEASYPNVSGLPGQITGYSGVQPSKSPTDTFLQLSTEKTSALKPGETASFSLKSTTDLSSVTMQVMARGRVVYSQNVEINGKQTTLTFPVTNEMAPKGRLVVYTVLPANKEVIVDALNFDVDGLFKNKVEVSFEPTEVQPYTDDGKKNQVSITVKADPASFVGLLAVDQSVLLLKSGNDITPELVESDISQYDSVGYGGGCFDCIAFRRKRSIWFPWYLGGKDASSIFENSGMLVLTDAYLYKHCEQYEPRGSPIPVFFAGPAPMLVREPLPVPPGIGGAGLPQQVVVRTRFEETWIWLNTSAEYPELEELAGDNLRGIADQSAPLAAGIPREEAEKEQSTIATSAVVVRSLFPESWIWLNASADSNGQVVYRADVPDTITSWIASAFAINDATGLGVAPETAKLKVFRPFFISLNLPYSVKRGEQLALQVLVFNYMGASQSVRVELEHNDKSGFDFVDKPGATKEKKQAEYNVRTIDVPGGGGSKVVFFPIIPRIVGDLKLTVKAWAQQATDGVAKDLLVEAEGVPLFFNKPVLIDLTKPTNGDRFNQTVLMTPPPNSSIVDSSERAEFSLIGDIMGPMLNNIDDLVRMPYGCGEQNMLNFVPNIVVMRYLTATSRLTPAIAAKAKSYMEAGYQRELTYKRSDNSFSAFGESDKHGSTWLTAFVLRAFKQAQPYIYVDQKILDQSLGFLLEQQTENGMFVEHGEVHHKDMQGGSAESGAALTAYALLALLENNQPNTNALNYLEKQLPSLANNPYALAIVSYTLQLANSSKKDEALTMLENFAIVKDGMKHWEQKVGGTENQDKEPWWYDAPRPVDVEMTSYALLVYVAKQQITEGLPIVRWLATRRNDHGGFGSTQDTVIGIQALAAYAEKAYSDTLNMQVTITQGSLTQSLTLSPQNSIELQKVQLQGIQTPVTISAQGQGLGFAQVAYHYNVPSLKDVPAFDCTEELFQPTDGEVQLAICCKYTQDGRSNMAVIEMNTLSGYAINKDLLNQLPSQVESLQRVETSNDDTTAAVYFNSIGANLACFNVSQQAVYQVADLKPANIKIYDYYKPVDKVEKQYSPKQKRSLQAQCPDCWDPASSGVVDANEDCKDEWPERCVRWTKLFPSLCQSPAKHTKDYMSRYCANSCNVCS